MLALFILLSPAAADAAVPWREVPAPPWVTRIAPDLASGNRPAGHAATNRGVEYLLLQKHVRTAGSTAEVYTHWVERITNEAGLQAAAMLSWDVDPTYEQLDLHSVVVHRGTERLSRLHARNIRVTSSQERMGNSLFESAQTVALVLDDVRVGDVIEAAYTFRSKDPTLGNRASVSTGLGTTEPVDRLHVTVSLPDAGQPKWKLHRPSWMTDEPAPSEARTAFGTELTWDLRNLPGEAEEPDAPAWYSPVPWIQVSGFGAWRDVAAWGLELYGRAAEPSPEVRELAQSWRKAARSDDELMQKAIRFVQDEVRYVGVEVGMGRRKPSSASAVLARRHGDCKDKSVLLAALLRAANIPAHPALVSTSHGPILGTMLPTPSDFDHVIVRIGPVEGTYYWVDPTQRAQAGGLERSRYSPFGHALVLRSGADALERLPVRPAGDSSLTVVETFTVPPVRGDRPVELEVERVYTSEFADRVRARLQGQSPKDTDEYYLNLHAEQFPRIEQAAPVEVHDDRETDVLRAKGHYRIPGFWGPAGQDGEMIAEVAPALMRGVIQRPSSTARKAPLAFAHPISLREEIHLLLPEAWSAGNGSVEVPGPAFAFAHSTRYADRRLDYVWTVESKAEAVEGGAFAEHVAAVDGARTHLTKTLTYVPPAPDGLSWPAVGVAALLLGVVGGGAWRAHRWNPPRPASAVMAAPLVPGMGGLSMGLFFLGLRTYVSPLTLGAQLLKFEWAFSRAEWAGVGAPDLARPFLVAFSGFMVAVFFAWSVIAAIAHYRRKRVFRTHFMGLTATYMVWMIASPILERTLLAEAGGPAAGPSVLGSLVISAVFLVYVRSSSRVAARFAEP